MISSVVCVLLNKVMCYYGHMLALAKAMLIFSLLSSTIAS